MRPKKNEVYRAVHKGEVESEHPLHYVTGMTYRKYENRRERKYRAEVVVHYRHGLSPDDKTIASPSEADAVRVPAFHDYVAFVFEAGKPSGILDEDEAFDQVEGVLDTIEEACRIDDERRQEIKRYEELAQQAQRIASYAAEEISDRAKKAVRYKQRLAALRAELDAELKHQTQEAEKEGLIDTVEIPESFHTDSKLLAKKVLPTFTEAKKNTGILHHTPQIDPSNVGELLEEARQEEEEREG